MKYNFFSDICNSFKKYCFTQLLMRSKISGRDWTITFFSVHFPPHIQLRVPLLN